MGCSTSVPVVEECIPDNCNNDARNAAPTYNECWDCTGFVNCFECIDCICSCCECCIGCCEILGSCNG